GHHAAGRGVAPRLLPHPAYGAGAPRPVLPDERGRGCGRRGHRDHRRRPGDGALPARALRQRPRAMTAGSGPLAELLDALAPPLEYLAADGFRQAARTSLPLRALTERLARARAEAGPGGDRALGELDEVLAALRGAAPDARP